MCNEGPQVNLIALKLLLENHKVSRYSALFIKKYIFLLNHLNCWILILESIFNDFLIDRILIISLTKLYYREIIIGVIIWKIIGKITCEIIGVCDDPNNFTNNFSSNYFPVVSFRKGLTK